MWTTQSWQPRGPSLTVEAGFHVGMTTRLPGMLLFQPALQVTHLLDPGEPVFANVVTRRFASAPPLSAFGSQHPMKFLGTLMEVEVKNIRYIRLQVSFLKDRRNDRQARRTRR